MKKIFLLLFCFCFCFCTSCSKNQSSEPVAEEQAFANSIDTQVASEIEIIENVSALDDETIKALSVVIRTNILNGESENISNEEYNYTNEHIFELVSETSGEILSNEESSLTEEIYIEESETEEEWSKEIKKVEILKYLKKKEISLSNLSTIKNETNENGRTNKIIVGGKTIDYNEIMKEFDIPSNKIDSIEQNVSNITIYGSGKGTENNFKLFEAETDAKDGQNYKKILKNQYNNFDIITK